MSEQEWGIWGGRGTQCSFRVASGPDRLGYGTQGTREEAEAGLKVFQGEAAMYSTGGKYEIAAYDPTREPPSKKGALSAAQIVFLQSFKDYTNDPKWCSQAYNLASREARNRSTGSSLVERGMLMLDPPRLTRAGREALSKAGKSK